MTLPLPRAGNSPGRAPGNLAPIEARAGGEIIGDLGKAMLDIGTAAVNDQLDRQLKRATVDMTRDINDLRLQIEEIGDPDRADRAWQDGMASLRASYVGENRTGSERLSARNVEKFELGFDQLSNSVAFSLGRRSLGLRNAQREATWTDYAHEATRAAAGADAKTRAALLRHGEDQIAGLLARGAIDGGEARRRLEGLREGMASADAATMAAADPARFLSSVENGGLSDVDERVRNGLVRRARAAQSAQGREAAAQITRRIGEMSAQAFNPAQPIDRAFLENDAVKAHPDYPGLVARLDLARDVPEFPALPPDEMRAIGRGHGARRMIAEEMAAAAARGYASDPVAYGRQAGLATPDMPDFDLSEPASYADGLARRVAHSEFLAEEGYVRGHAPLLARSERTALAERLAEDEGAEMALAESVKARFGDEALAVLENLGVNPDPHDPDRAGVVARRIVADPDAARLARAWQFSPTAPEAVSEMDARLARLDAADPAERPAVLAGQIEEAARARRAALARPRHYDGGEITLDGLKAAAGRLVSLHRAGRMDAQTFTRQGALIRAWLETFDG